MSYLHNLLSFLKGIIPLFRKSKKVRRAAYFAITIVLLGFLVAIAPPQDFPVKQILTVRDGAPINEVGNYLEEHHVVKDSWLFSIFIHVMNSKSGVLAGKYYFERPINLLEVAYHIARGDFGLKVNSFFIPEGTNIFQIADLAQSAFSDFDSKKFLELAKENEGFLFPDTYHFLPTVTPQEMIDAMRANFDDKIKALEEELRNSGRPLKDIVTMASYLEEEARLLDTRRIIAGILWKRIEIGMPLQIDASFQYVNGKNTFQLTTQDLQIDSPYNTYKYKGLTPGPISNPGLTSILAALTPTKTKYLFFLTDNHGVMHYAITHDEHVANKNRYLK